MSVTEEIVNTNTIEIPRFFTDGRDVYSTVKWGRYNVKIQSEHDGSVVYKQDGVEFPDTWSERARTMFADKYFKMHNGVKEASLWDVIQRIVLTMKKWGIKGGYFGFDSLHDETHKRADVFADELMYILLHQYAAPNSPVWFNLGSVVDPQTAACFILGCKDKMESITDISKIEGRIFQMGSGSGFNLSKLRAFGEPLSRGGTSSGPIQFMKSHDANAGSIKSGGSTRRAAKMVVMNDDHPDVYHGPDTYNDFIGIKAEQEDIAWAIHKTTGRPLSFNHPHSAYDNTHFQNGNNSVSVTDSFMLAAIENREWKTTYRVSGEDAMKFPAREMLKKMANMAWRCGDPGVQFNDHMNRWHTCPDAGPITATNPCSEVIFIDWSACNLASLNLMKYRTDNGSIDIESYLHVIKIMILAQEILVSNSSYPDPRITENAHRYRNLGMGYANLGALLMSLGLPYDSDDGRAMAGSLASIMTAQAYKISSEIASVVGPFEGWSENKEYMLNVIKMHKEMDEKRISGSDISLKLHRIAHKLWSESYEMGQINGYRNSQATLMAPTGTISFIMDCDSTGIEPMMALVYYKKLVGEGQLTMRTKFLGYTLETLGYETDDIAQILSYIDENGSVEGCKEINTKHLDVFDCSFKAAGKTRCLSPMGHIKMLEAVQPFISGGISKTINMPESSTPEDIEQIFIEAWQRGVKSVAVYRDGSKGSQPLSTSKYRETSKREQLPHLVPCVREKVAIGPSDSGYMHVGFYEDGRVGEIFMCIGKEGGMAMGMMRNFGMAISYLLQYGVPLKFVVKKFIYQKFDPSGPTGNPIIPFCDSVVDFMVKWLAIMFLDPADWEELGIKPRGDWETERDNLHKQVNAMTNIHFNGGHRRERGDAGKKLNLSASLGVCDRCGGMTFPSGGCRVCGKCGQNTGCS